MRSEPEGDENRQYRESCSGWKEGYNERYQSQKRWRGVNSRPLNILSNCLAQIDCCKPIVPTGIGFKAQGVISSLNSIASHQAPIAFLIENRLPTHQVVSRRHFSCSLRIEARNVDPFFVASIGSPQSLLA